MNKTGYAPNMHIRWTGVVSKVRGHLAHAPATKRQMCDAMGLTYSELNHAINYMRRNEEVKCIGMGEYVHRGPRPKVWALADFEAPEAADDLDRERKVAVRSAGTWERTNPSSVLRAATPFDALLL